MLRIILVVLLLTISLVASIPPRPKWPAMFSSGIDVILVDKNDRHDVFTGRWFWDESQNSERYDLHHHLYREIKINDYSLGEAFHFQTDARAPWNCSVDKITTHMPVYDFGDFNYVDDEVIRGMDVHVWQHTLTSYFVKYYARSDNQDPVRIEIHQTKDKEIEIINLFEFDKGTQDPDLFNRSMVFPKVSCPKQESSIEEQIDNLNSLLPDSVCSQTVDCAKRYASCGCPYVWGGNSCGCSGKGGLDCSGIVHTCYVASGYSGISRTSEAQSHQGSSCGSCSPSATSSCKKGDLFFYNTEGKGVSHVVMYIGGGQVAECPHTGLNCRILTPYSGKYVSCRRFC